MRFNVIQPGPIETKVKKHMYKYCMLTTPTYGLDVLRLALHVCMYMSYGPAKQAAVLGALCVLQGAFSRLDPTGSFKQAAIDRMPTGRLGEVQEIANLACYMVSDYASWMSGSVSTCVLVFDCTKDIYLS